MRRGLANEFTKWRQESRALEFGMARQCLSWARQFVATQILSQRIRLPVQSRRRPNSAAREMGKRVRAMQGLPGPQESSFSVCYRKRPDCRASSERNQNCSRLCYWLAGLTEQFEPGEFWGLFPL